MTKFSVGMEGERVFRTGTENGGEVEEICSYVWVWISDS